MAVLNAPARQATVEEFERLAALPEYRDMRLERTAQGELLIMAPAGSETGYQNLSIAAQLYLWARQDKSGVAFDSSAGFRLPSSAVLSPDASWLRRERWEALTPAQRGTFAPLCPDFVVELRSRTDRLGDVQAKMREYIENGARLGWLIDPQNKCVEIYRPGGEIEQLRQPSTLSGEDVLPGFTLDLEPIWA